jgi:hypothetical protein
MDAHRFGPSIIATSVLLLACAEHAPPIDPAVHAAEVAEWRAERIAKLTQADGWITLVGLFWIPDGSHTFGADSANALVYAGVNGSVPPRIGVFHVQGDAVGFDAERGVSVQLGDSTVSTADARPAEGDPPVFRLGSLEWFVITRNGEHAIRARDSLSVLRTGFADDQLPMFDGAGEWRLQGTFEWKEPADTIEIPNILGTVNSTPSPASVRFRVDGKTYRLALWKDSDDPANFFTAFADGTNGNETYGGGRFLWIDAPDAEGHTIVDFNHSYNPPCVFTAFSTCPLPPQQNRLPFEIRAGEKSFVPREE